MEAKLVNNRDITVIHIMGTLDIEHTQGLKEVARKKLSGKKILFNMAGANFVGSTGIGAFVETVQMLTGDSDRGIGMVGLSPDFRRIFQNLELQQLQIFDNEDQALNSLGELIPQLPKGIAPIAGY